MYYLYIGVDTLHIDVKFSYNNNIAMLCIIYILEWIHCILMLSSHYYLDRYDHQMMRDIASYVTTVVLPRHYMCA